MSTIITVTQEDIDHGKKGDCGECPIARAAKRAFPALFPTVSCYNLYLDSAPGRDDGHGTPLPQKASEFVQDFDRGRPVEPFSFEVSAHG